MFKFLICFVLVLHICCVLAVAAPNPAQMPESIHKKSRGKGKGARPLVNESECNAMEKKIADKKKHNKQQKGAVEMQSTVSRAELPHEDRQFEWIAVTLCATQRVRCNAAYELCIQTGVGCTSCWEECDDLKECALALGRNYATWAVEGGGNSFECQEECGCIFRFDP